MAESTRVTPLRRLAPWLAALWPRRVAALVVLAMAVNEFSASSFMPAFLAALQCIAALALWKRWRWGRVGALVLQGAIVFLEATGEPRMLAAAAWWLQQWPHAAVVLLLLLPESRHSRAALRESGFEPGDTVPVQSSRR